MGKRKRVRREEGWKNRRVVTLMVSGMVRKWRIAAATAVRLFFFFLLRQKNTLAFPSPSYRKKSEEEATTTQLWHYMKRHTQENSSSSSRLKEYYIVVNLWRAVSDGDSGGGLYFQVCAAVLPYLDGFPKQRLMKLCSSRRVGLEGATQCISIHLSAYALF